MGGVIGGVVIRNKKAKYLNENIFDEWTHENCWILGLLTADGSIGSNSRPHEFKLYSTDYDLVKAVKDVFESEKQIYSTSNTKGRLGKKTVYYLMLSSPKICKFFKEVKVYGDKDNRNPFQYIPDKYKWSFIKGLLDGDGNVYKNKMSIAGRADLITDVYYWICKKLNRDPNKIYQSTSSEKTVYFLLSESDSHKALRFFEELSPNTYKSQKYHKLLGGNT